MHKTTRDKRLILVASCSLISFASSLFAQDDDERRLAATQRTIREAASRAVRLVDQTSATFLKTRKCFTCHTQTLSAIVLGDAQKRGFDVDEQNLKRQVERALEFHEFVKPRKPGTLRVDTVGYGLWALDIGQYAPDAMTEDMTWYLLNYQKDLGYWKTTVHRPPTEASDFSTNYVAIRGLNRYGTAEQKEEIAERTAAVKQWLKTAVAADTEDQVFRLWLAHELKVAAKEKETFAQKLLGEQHDGGGWAQKPDMKPDAYATGSALVALHEAGAVPTDDPKWQRGLGYLLRTQKPDGSWHVVTRSKPEQVYFESGFPHGKDQFISAFATGWATEALLLALRPRASKETVREAATRSIRLFEKSSARSLKERKCVTCHHQTISLMVFGAAREAGIEIDKANSRRQLARAFDYYNSRREQFLSGEIEHQAIPVGYGLWALDLGGHVPDEVTKAVTSYLLNYQKELGHWKPLLNRPPAEASHFTANYVAIRGLNRYGTAEQKEEIAERTAAVKQWLKTAVAADTEDQVFRLWLAHEVKMAPEKKQPFVQQLLSEQHDNGGWAQKPGMKPDAYATGSVLVALHAAGRVSREDPSWQYGVDYLLQTQKPDGSWHVVSRSEPFQDYFESGFPHGKDQFISAYATGWATTALLLSRREEK